jgi:hypothetical protein
MSPRARSPSRPTPSQKRRFWGNPSALSTVLPVSSVRLKLTTSPPIIR